MLRSARRILHYHIRAIDDEIGKVRDLYFDDRDWKVRYVVADTGRWLPGRQVLISPESIGQPEWNVRLVPGLPVQLTKEQIELIPPVASDKPVSRQHEAQLASHFGWAAYWVPRFIATPPPSETAQTADAEVQEDEGDSHLRSLKEVTGYHILASDGQIGHAEDVIVDTNEWAIRYVVVDTRNWLPGKRVLVAQAWVERVDWAANLLHVDLTRDLIKNAPQFDASDPINREYEGTLYDYYGRPKYWQRPTETPVPR